MEHPSAVILLSGGLDSVTALAWAQRQPYTLRGALSFTYGQRHIREVAAAAAIAARYDVPHQLVALSPIGGSSLTKHDDGAHRSAALPSSIAPTYVPNRNMILLAYAAAYALCDDITGLIGGWNAADATHYPDCRDEFLAATQHALQLATERAFMIIRPLIHDDKPAIVRRALELKAPIHLTWTCYSGGDEACGECAACQLRINAFQQIGVIDPIAYATPIDWFGCQPYKNYEIRNPQQNVSF